MTDHKARYGYEPTWDLQKKKQEKAAEEYYARLYGEVEIPEPEDNDEESN